MLSRLWRLKPSLPPLHHCARAFTPLTARPPDAASNQPERRYSREEHGGRQRGTEGYGERGGREGYGGRGGREGYGGGGREGYGGGGREGYGGGRREGYGGGGGREAEEEQGQGGERSTWNLISCNAAISRMAQQGRRGAAFALFFRMQDERVRPNRVTFLSLLKAFTGPGDLESGRRVHELVVARHLDSDVRVGTALVCMYFRCGSPADAARVFRGIQQRDVILWNAMVEGYCQAGLRAEALEVFRAMSVEPDMATFLSVFKSCNEAAHLEDAKRLHGMVIESGLELSVRVQTALVGMYGKCGSLPDARRVFDKLPRKDVGLWTTMIAGYVQNGHGNEAFELFQAMRDAGMRPNKMTFLALLKACMRPEFLDRGTWLHGQICLAGLQADEKVGTALITMYCKCRSLADARKVFDNLVTRNVISWTALIAGYAHNGRAEEALDLYEQMQREGVQPNEITRKTVVDACSRLGAV